MFEEPEVKMLTIEEAMTCINVFAVQGLNPSRVPVNTARSYETVPAWKALKNFFGIKVSVTKEIAKQLCRTTQYSLPDIEKAFGLDS